MIGDVIDSRHYPDRSVLQSTLLEAFAEVNEAVDSLHGFRITLGDEFQGLFASIGQALLSAFWLRIRLLLDRVEVRFGIGWGEVPVRDAIQAPFAQDGPSWWFAREALERINDTEQRNGWPKNWRTAMKSADPGRDGLVNAFLLCRDGLIDHMDEKDLILIGGHLKGATQKELAKRLDISKSAVTQRQQRHGIYSVLRAHEQIEDLIL